LSRKKIDAELSVISGSESEQSVYKKTKRMIISKWKMLENTYSSQKFKKNRLL